MNAREKSKLEVMFTLLKGAAFIESRAASGESAGTFQEKLNCIFERFAALADFSTGEQMKTVMIEKSDETYIKKSFSEVAALLTSDEAVPCLSKILYSQALDKGLIKLNAPE
jgi:hypothetical protein